jgi:hypothetical protein
MKRRNAIDSWNTELMVGKMKIPIVGNKISVRVIVRFVRSLRVA